MYIVISTDDSSPLEGTIESICLTIEAARIGVQECREAYHYTFKDDPNVLDLEFKVYKYTGKIKVRDRVCLALQDVQEVG